MTETQNTKRVIPCEVYSRVVGYYRPVQNWNVGKKQEFKERRYYDRVYTRGERDNTPDWQGGA